jgi:hypothetical protein
MRHPPVTRDFVGDGGGFTDSAQGGPRSNTDGLDLDLHPWLEMVNCGLLQVYGAR